MKIWTWESIFPKQRERCSPCFIVVKLLNMNFILILEKKSVNQNTIFNISSVLAEHFWSMRTSPCYSRLSQNTHCHSLCSFNMICALCGSGLYCAIVLENFNFLNLPCIASAIYFAVWWLFGGIMDTYYCMYKTKTYQSIPPLANSRYSSKQTIRVGLVI